jgi:hypothetical protein
MSAETLRAVEEALQAHIRNEDDDNSIIVTAWYTSAAVIIPAEINNGMSEYRYVHAHGQDVHVHAGLLWVAQNDALTRPAEPDK